LERVGERIFELAGRRFNINSPKQLGEVLFTDLGLPAPASRGKGKAISTAQDVLEQLAEKHEVPRLVLEYRHLSKLKSNYIDALPLLADAESRVHTTFQAAATATGGFRRSIRICRTFPFAPSWAARFARHLRLRRDATAFGRLLAD
jgi:DNA polymerase I